MCQDGGDEEEGAGMEHKEGHSEGQRRQLVYLLRQQAQSMVRGRCSYTGGDGLR